jgi:DNA-binding beta-propeller fold protein YncE
MALACFSAWVALAIVTLCLIVPDAMEMIWSGPSAAEARGQKQRQSSVASRVPPSFFNFVEAKRNGVDGVQGLGRAWAVVVSSEGKNVYAAGFQDSFVVVFSRDLLTSKLAFLEAHQNGVSGLDGLSATQSVLVVPDGKRVYAAGWGDNTLVAFARDNSTGKLAPLEVQRDGVGGMRGLRGPAGLTVCLDGKHLYIAASGDQGIGVFRTN